MGISGWFRTPDRATENYRGTSPILTVAREILRNAPSKIMHVDGVAGKAAARVEMQVASAVTNIMGTKK